MQTGSVQCDKFVFRNRSCSTVALWRLQDDPLVLVLSKLGPVSSCLTDEHAPLVNLILVRFSKYLLLHCDSFLFILQVVKWTFCGVNDRSIDWLVDRLCDCSIVWSIDWLIDWLIGGCVVGWLIGLFVLLHFLFLLLLLSSLNFFVSLQRCDWCHGSVEVFDTYVTFVSSLLASQPTYADSCLRNIIRRFRTVPLDMKPDLNSNSFRGIDDKLKAYCERIHAVLARVVHIVPL